MAPYDRLGYWGRPTSTLDWCEENYAVSFYIAEFWNTVSNLIMIVPPLYGALQTFRDGIEIRFVLAFLGIAAVGVGSWCFHMTLQYEMQVWVLPFFGISNLPLLCFWFFSDRYECFKQEKTVHFLLITILLGFSISVTLVYLQWKEPVFHQVVYGMLVSCLVLRSLFIVSWVYPNLRRLAYTSLAVFLLGFALWNIDNLFCSTLQSARKRVPPLVGAMTQFHALWHILTGLGSYLLTSTILHGLIRFFSLTKCFFVYGVWPVVHVDIDKTF
uniref:Alkaline ceramidase n=1 Tax=Paramormyrops kingsleyae TaxID=1676925 RepID=A0A3B3RT20_9TELE